MPDAPPASPANLPALPDPWASQGRLPLGGVLERNDFPPLLIGFSWFVGGFIVFQGIGLVASALLLVVKGAVSQGMTVEDINAGVSQNLRELLIVNSAGQFIGLGLCTLGVARLHTSQTLGYLRLRGVDAGLFGLGMLGFVALSPVVQWLTVINQQLPIPEFFREMDAARMEMIESVLMGGELSLAFTLFVIALTPAICEEVYFRGYLQRQFERSSLGSVGGIVASGVLFGAYHFSASQLIPLSALGLYLAYLTWRTGSLWPAIMVHFCNNAFYAVLGRSQGGAPAPDAAPDLETMGLPWYIVAAGLVGFVAICYALHRRAHMLKEMHQAAPGAAPPSLSD